MMAFFYQSKTEWLTQERVATHVIACSVLFLHGSLGEFALQGAAVHVECAGGRGNIAVMRGEDFLQVFPFQSFH